MQIVKINENLDILNLEQKTNINFSTEYILNKIKSIYSFKKDPDLEIKYKELEEKINLLKSNIEEKNNLIEKSLNFKKDFNKKIQEIEMTIYTKREKLLGLIGKDK